jgi:aminopeptidase N
MRQFIKRFAWLLLLAWVPCVHAAAPHLNLEVRLDPHTRAFAAKADLTTAGAVALSLDPLFKISRASVNGVPVAAERISALRRNGLARPAGDKPQRLSIEYSGLLPALPTGNQRNSANPSNLFASPEGSYLSPGGDWYPDPGSSFTYRVTLSLPADQKGLAPGNQIRLTEGGSRFIAEYEFDHPAEGVWLMAGPFEVAHQSFVLNDGKRVTVRTWFHPELSAMSGGYLEDSIRYIQRYSRLIGDYPFGDFSIVSSPLSHGLGIPSLTYLGRDVLRLPFIRATSLGHEVLHNWWGNGVYPEWTSGNWSEGLTTFMADYAFREDQSEQAAREMRLNWLRDLAAVAAPDESSLAQFKSRQHGISSVVGYGKAAMLFFMLRDEIGRPAFDQGVRLFWQSQRFKTASWRDLEASFSQAAGRDLSGFFAQWVHRAASPQLTLAPSNQGGNRYFRLVQQGPEFDMLVPLRIRSASGETRELKVRLREREKAIDLASASMPPQATAVELDPELQLWRRLDSRSVPPIFREVFISPRAGVFVTDKSAAWTEPATALANRLLDTQARVMTDAELLAAPEVPALVVGDADGIARLLPRLGIGRLPDVLWQDSPVNPGAGGAQRLKGTAQAWTARAANGKTFAFVMAASPDVLGTLHRAMPHYGRQSWLVFQDGRVAEQGAWPVQAQTLLLER